ncbi:MAG: hypothetical protein JXR77_13965, partial [Lentisphaeria bacterium]|nr:hypothetical protein [Lentisphaeria bacterium]
LGSAERRPPREWTARGLAGTLGSAERRPPVRIDCATPHPLEGEAPAEPIAESFLFPLRHYHGEGNPA